MNEFADERIGRPLDQITELPLLNDVTSIY